MRAFLGLIVVVGCGHDCGDGAAHHLPDAPDFDAPSELDAPDAPVDAPAADAPVAITLTSSFTTTGSCGLAFDPTASEVLVYPCSSGTITRYSTTGTSLGTIAFPGEVANDVDLDVVSAAFTLGATAIPAGTLLVANGETDAVDLYAGSATLAVQFGASHVVGAAFHAARGTVFVVQDHVPDAAEANRVAEINPMTGAVVATWQTTPFEVNYGDLDVCQSTGNLFIVSNAETTIAEFTPAGVLVGKYPLPVGANDPSGLAILDGTGGTAWIGSPSGSAAKVAGLPCN